SLLLFYNRCELCESDYNKLVMKIFAFVFISLLTPLCAAALAQQQAQNKEDLLRTIGQQGWSLPVPAQQKREQEQRPGVTLRIDTDVVTVDVVAMDKNGNYLRDLRADEFELFEDGKARKLDFFAVNDESTLTRPLAVVFALDTSGSLRPEE